MFGQRQGKVFLLGEQGVRLSVTVCAEECAARTNVCCAVNQIILSFKVLRLQIWKEENGYLFAALKNIAQVRRTANYAIFLYSLIYTQLSRRAL